MSLPARMLLAATLLLAGWLSHAWDLRSQRLVMRSRPAVPRRRLLQDAPPPPLASTGAAAVATGNATDLPPFRIIGGVQALRDRFRFVCSLRDASGRHYCGCSLIAPNVALTAAHCVNQTDPALNRPVVEVGRYFRNGVNASAGGTEGFDVLRCTRSVVHPGWSFARAQNDIALCFLDAASRFPTVTLASASTLLAPSTNLTVMGWGATQEGGGAADALMSVDVAPMDFAACNTTYGGKVSANQICAGLPAGGADACQGDSGGPLIIEGLEPGTDLQIGIVSYGSGCGRPGVPGVYTDVRAYRPYIAQQLLAANVLYLPLVSPASNIISSNATGAVTSAGAAIAPNTPPAPLLACSCTANGASGAAMVPAVGCKQHALATGDASYYCYVVGGLDCAAATASQAFLGAAWIPCTPLVLQFASTRAATAEAIPGSDPAAATLLAPVPTTSELGSDAATVRLVGMGAAQQAVTVARAVKGFWKGFTSSLGASLGCKGRSSAP